MISASKQYGTLAVLIGILMALTDCAGEAVSGDQLNPEREARRREIVAENKEISAKNREVALDLGVSMSRFRQLPKVNPRTLYLQNFSVGRKTISYGSIITLSYDKDPEANYIQIKRCDASILIDGLQNKPLGEVDGTDISALQKKYDHINSGELEKGYDIYDIDDYWRNATISGCELVGNRIFEDRYYDMTALPDHEYYYIARVCIRYSRIDQTLPGADITCSFNIHKSNTIFYSDIIVDREREIKMRYQRSRNRMNEYLGTIHGLVLKLADEYDRCESRNVGRTVTRNRKEAIALLAGIAVGAVVALTTGNAASLSFFADAGAALGSTINDLMADSEDYEHTCTEALKIEGQLDPYRDKFKVLKEQLDAAKEDLKTIERLRDSIAGEKDILGDEAEN